MSSLLDDYKEIQPEPVKQNKGLLSDLGTMAKIGVQELPGVATGVLDLLPNLIGLNSPYSRITDLIGESTGFQPKQWAQQAAQEYSPAQQEAAAIREQAKQDYAQDGNFSDLAGAYLATPRGTLRSVVESLPVMAAGIGVGRAAQGLAGMQALTAADTAAGITVPYLPKLAGTIAGNVGEGITMAGSANEQLRDTVADPRMRAAAALPIGAAGTVIGRGSSKLANALGLDDVASLGMNNAGQVIKTTGSNLKRIAGTGLVEGAEEVAQTYPETGLQNLAQGKPFNQGMASNLLDAGLAGAAMGGSFSGAGVLTRAAQKAPATLQQENSDNRLTDAVQSSGQNWQSPDFKINPNYQGIIDNQFQNPNPYNPLAGTWETPSSKPIVTAQPADKAENNSLPTLQTNLDSHEKWWDNLSQKERLEVANPDIIAIGSRQRVAYSKWSDLAPREREVIRSEFPEINNSSFLTTEKLPPQPTPDIEPAAKVENKRTEPTDEYISGQAARRIRSYPVFNKAWTEQQTQDYEDGYEGFPFNTNALKSATTPTQPEAKNENNNPRAEEIPAGNVGPAHDKPGVPAKEQAAHDQTGTEKSPVRVRKGQSGLSETGAVEGQRNELPANEPVVRHPTNGGAEHDVKPQTGEHGRISRAAGENNFSLENSPNIVLTPAKRRDINRLAEEILNKPVNEITEADKNILRQYTGVGGLATKDQQDKGEGVFNQHFTNYDTIKAMYNALADAGIKFKYALEPSVGSGNFIGMNPRADWVAVDIDKTNTEIVKRLYPDATVHHQSYEDFGGTDFDLIISNVPFASFADLPRAKANLVKPGFKAIHNFFFAQSVDKLKEGGVMAFMTSTGTMDGITEAKKLREYLVKHLDVIGAFRLPAGTQKANASTDVMIDIIFLQKRPEGVESKQAIKNQAFVKIGSKDGIKINQYFLDYPDSVLGDIAVGKIKMPQGSRDALLVTGEPKYENIKLYPQSYKTSKRANNSEFDGLTNYHAAKEYAEQQSYQFINEKITQPFYKDGYIYDMPFTYHRSTDGGIFGRKATGLQAEKVAALQEIDNTLLTDQAKATQLVADYEAKYSKAPHKDNQLQQWAKQNHVSKTLKAFEALFDKDFNLSERFTKKVRFENSGKIEVTPESPLLERAESLEDVDGFIILDKSKHLLSDVEIQDLLDSGDYARTGSNAIQNSRLYYAGNIYHKIDALNRVTPKAQRDKQAAKLEAVKPKPIPLANITITGKEAWISDDPEIKTSLGIETFNDGTITISAKTIEDAYHRDLMQRYLNNDSLVKKLKDETPEENAARAKQAQETLTTEVLPLIKQKLVDDGLSNKIVESYNRSKNFFVAPVFDGSSLKNLPKTFKGKPFKLMKHQQEGAERAIYNKKGVLAFSPGLGKTPTAIVVAWELLNKGVMKKPLFIVPANTIHQWESSTKSLYPNANVFEFPKYSSGVNKGQAKEWQSLTAADKERMVHDLANNQYDYTFISTNLATKFTIPEKKMQQYIDDLAQSISSMELPDDELTKSQIKAKLKRIAKLNMLKETMMAAFNDDAASGFDMGKMGFDAIFADEVQYYKNIGMQSEDAKGGIGANVSLNAKYPMITDENGNTKPDTDASPLAVTIGSARSYDFRFKTMYISEKNNGNNIFLLTGTPTPNKPLELLTLLQHLDTHILDEYGINNVGDFVNEFLSIAAVETTGIDGNPKMESQLVAMNNIDALKKIITRYVDYRSPESAGDLVRPKQINKVHTILRNDDSELVFADIQDRIIQSIEDAKAMMSGNALEDAEKLIVMYGAGRDASIDVRLYKPSSKSRIIPMGTTFEEETRADYSKIAKTVQLVTQKLKSHPNAGQLIFLDRLKYPQGGSTHEDIRNKVMQSTGLAPNQVVYVNGGEHVNPATGKIVKSGPDAKRLQEIMDAYNAGKIKVLIGNTSKLGVGVDLQVHTTDIYQIDKPYRPDEVEQRNNRGVRQGNLNAEVTVHTFNQPGTFDAMSDRILANKQGFNDVYWKEQDSDRADIAAETPPNPYDAAIELEQDPLKRRKLEIERDLSQARNVQNNLEKQISNLAKRIKSAQHNIETFTAANKGIDNRETPAYEDQSPAERAKSIKAFKQRLAEQKAKNLEKIAAFNDDLVKLNSDKEGRVAELEQHKTNISELKSRYVVDNVVSLDAIKRYENIKYSQSAAPDNGHTAASLKAGLTKAFGQAWLNRLLSTDKFKIINRAEAKGMGVNDNAQAFYNPKDDSTYFIAENIDQRKDLKKLMLHELGVHALQLGRTSAQFNAILKQLNELTGRRVKSKALQAAIDAAERANTPEHLMLEEIAGYLVEFHPELSVSQKIVAFFRNQLRKLGLINGLTEQDIVFMAHSTLRTAPESLLFNGDVTGEVRGSYIRNVAAWTDERIKSLFSLYAYTMDDLKTKALAGYVSPNEFLKATTSESILKDLENETGALDKKELANNRQPIFLQGKLSDDKKEFKITDHEGRHRMIALRNAGIDRVPIVFEVQGGMQIDFIGALKIVGQYIDGKEREGFIAKFLTPINYAYRDNLIDEFKEDGNQEIRYSLASDVKDFFTGRDAAPQTLSDVLDSLNSGKPKTTPIDKQYWFDKIVTNFTDLSRPFDRWVQDTFNPIESQLLINGKDRAQGMKQAYEKEAMDKFGRPLSDAIRAIAKQTGMKFQTAKDMEGYWMSATYAPEANAWLLEKDQTAIDNLEQEKYDAIQNFNTIQSPSNESRARLDAKLDALDKQIREATTKRNQRQQAIDRQEFIDLPKIKQDLVELRKDRTANASEIQRLEAILEENVGLAGGLNNYTAQELIKQIEAKIPRDLLKAAAKPVYGVLKWKLANDIKDGKVSQATVNTWNNSPNYVPLTGDPRTDDSVEDIFTTGSLNQQKDQAIQGRTGSIAQNAIDAAFEQVERSSRFHGWNEFKDSLHSIYNRLLAERMAQGLNQTEAIKELRDEFGINRRAADTNIPPGDNDIVWRKDNKGFIYSINNAAAMEALHEMTSETVPTILKPFGLFTTLQAKLVTMMMAGFAPTNFIRDSLEKSENIRTRTIQGYGSIDMNQVGRDTLSHAARLATTRLKMMAGVLAEDTPLSRFLSYDPNDTEVKQLKEYLRLGGSATYGEMLSHNTRELSEQLSKLNTKLDKGWSTLILYNNAFETISGFSAYKALIEQGVPPKIAAAEALNLMNFRKRGRILSPLRSLYMFLNPTAQGAQQLARTLSTPRGRLRLASYTVAAALLYSLLRGFDGDDEDELGFNRMDAQGNYSLYRNIHIPIGEGQYLKIPLGFGMQQIAWAHGVNLARTYFGAMSVPEMLAESALVWQKAVMPIAPAESSFTQNPMVFMAQTFTPQIFKPLVNVALDRTAFGSPLTNARYEKLDTAKALQGRKTTPQEYKDLAKFFAEHGIDVYPEQLREVVRGYLIGHLGDVLKLAIENPNAEKLARETVTPSLDRWITPNRDEMLKTNRYYRVRDEMNEAAVKRSTGGELTARESELARLSDQLKRLEARTRGKLSAATKAEKLGQMAKAENYRRQAEQGRERYINIGLEAAKKLS